VVIRSDLAAAATALVTAGLSRSAGCDAASRYAGRPAAAAGLGLGIAGQHHLGDVVLTGERGLGIGRAALPAAGPDHFLCSVPVAVVPEGGGEGSGRCWS
jgi:hypothetical protein